MWLTSNLLLSKEKAFVISPDPHWILIDYKNGYLYDGPTFWQLVKQVVTEWKNDKHIVG